MLQVGLKQCKSHLKTHPNSIALQQYVFALHVAATCLSRAEGYRWLKHPQKEPITSENKLYFLLHNPRLLARKIGRGCGHFRAGYRRHSVAITHDEDRPQKKRRQSVDTAVGCESTLHRGSAFRDFPTLLHLHLLQPLGRDCRSTDRVRPNKTHQITASRLS